MRTLGQFITVLLVIGFVGAYFWPIALTLAAAYLSYRVVLRALDGQSESPGWTPHRTRWRVLLRGWGGYVGAL